MTAVMKDLHCLIRRVGKLTDGQASVCDLDWDEGELDSFRFVITPNSGYYQGGTFKFKVGLGGEYEDESPPTVFCETDIYHPNIDTTELEYPEGSNICLNILDRGTWNRKFGLEGIVIGLVYLLHNPNLEDPLTPDFDSYIDIEDFKENVKKYMNGEEVDGRRFDADFLTTKKAVVDKESGDESPETQTENTRGNTEANNEAKDNENTYAELLVEAKGQNILNGNCGEDEIVIKPDFENVPTSTDSVSNGAIDVTRNGNDQTTYNVSSVDNNQINKNFEENVGVPGIEADQEDLLKQLEKFGMKDDNDSDDDSEGCTMITFDDESVLLPFQLQEESSETQTADDLPIQSEYPTCAGSAQRLNLSDNTNCEDTYSAIRSIVDELVVNAINIYPDQNEGFDANQSIVRYQTGGNIENVLNGRDNIVLPVLNMQENRNNETVSEMKDYAIADVISTNSPQADDTAAAGSDTQSILKVEVSPGKQTFTRQNSKEIFRNRARFLDSCTTYFKFIVYHTFRCLTKL